jgi:hypothetical protein
MKHLIKNLIFGCIPILLVITACSENDEIKPPLPDPIIGEWRMTKIVKDGIDLTDDCTTRSDLIILIDNSFSGDDYDAETNGCVLTNFDGTWWKSKTGNDNEYTFNISGREFIQVLTGNKLRAEFIHAVDKKFYIEEHTRK